MHTSTKTSLLNSVNEREHNLKKVQLNKTNTVRQLMIVLSLNPFNFWSMKRLKN